MDEQQYFVDAALRYEELLESGQQMSLDAFVASEPEPTRAELRAFLEFNLTLGELDVPALLTPEEEARANAIIARATAAAGGTAAAQPRNLTQLRGDAKLTVGLLARKLRLPVDLLARIERGKVAINSIPQRFVQELGSLLQVSADTVRSSLLAPPMSAGAVRFNADDGLVEAEEQVVTFAEAFAEGDPTPEQRTAWESDLA